MKTITRLGSLAFLLVALGAFWGAGCENSAGSTSPPDETAMLNEAGAPGAQVAPGALSDVSVADIDARIHLTDAQRPQMVTALNQLWTTQREWRGRRGAPPAQGGAVPAGDPPMVTFLESASQVLTPDQFQGLAQLITEHRQTAWKERAAGNAKGAGRHGPWMGGFGAGMAKNLDLTDAQKTQLKSVLQAAAGQAKPIRDQVRAGTLTWAAAGDQLEAIRTQTRTQVKGILTDAQWQKLDAARTAAIQERVDQRLAQLSDHLDRRATFLQRVLGLTPDQGAKVHDLVMGTLQARTDQLKAVRTGTVEPGAAAKKIAQIEQNLAGQIVPLLTPEQKTRWDALRALIPQGPQG